MSDIIYTDKMTGEEYNELRVAVGFSAITKEQARRGIENTTFLITARVNGKAVGMGRVMFDFGYTAYIGDVIVQPDFQGKSIGKTIVEKLIQKVKEHSDSGDNIMFVLLAAKGKEEFYEKLDFRRRPNDILGSGMSKWIKIE